MKKLIILDRDGVINEDSDHYIKSVDEWIPIFGSIDAIARLSLTGYLIAVASNQSGLARGYFTQAQLDTMHEKMVRLVGQAGGSIALIEYCPHHPDDGCQCRKPKPGMVNSILHTLAVSPADTWLVGDSLRDIQAGTQAGCKTALVKTGKGQKTLKQQQTLENTLVFDDLFSFYKKIVTSGI